MLSFVTRTEHTNRGYLWIAILGPHIPKIVVIKLIEPKIDGTSGRWRLEIVKSTSSPEWMVIPLKDG